MRIYIQKQNIGCFIALFFASFVFIPGLLGGFFFDDLVNLASISGLETKSISVQSIQDLLGSGLSGPLGRPVSQISFAFNYLFSGFDPFYFKITNLVIHLGNGWVVFLIAQQSLFYLSPLSTKRQQLWASLFVALVWLVHPLQVTSVLYVIQRMTSLSAFFMLLGLYFHIKGREQNNAWFLLASWGVFWPLSLLSKEIGALFPLFVLVWEGFVRRPIFGIDRFFRWYAFAMLAVGVLTVIYIISPQGHWLVLGYEGRAFTLIERLLSQGRVVCYYIGLFFAPSFESFGLYHDDFVPSKGIFEPWTTALSLVFLAALVAASLFLSRRIPVLAFGVLWYLSGHLLESTFIPLEMVHEHRNYLPLFGPLVAVGALTLDSISVNYSSRKWAVFFVSLFFVYCAFLTVMRSHLYGDELRRTQIEAQHHRDSPRAQYDAGRVLLDFPETKDVNSFHYFLSRGYFERATDLDKNFKLGLLGTILLNCNAGIPVSDGVVQIIASRFQYSPHAPGDRTVLYTIKEQAILNPNCIGPSEFDLIFDSALKNETIHSWNKKFLYSWRADYYWLAMKDLPSAKRALRMALDFQPADSSNRLKWAQLEILDGRLSEAARELVMLSNARLTNDERLMRAELMRGLGL